MVDAGTRLLADISGDADAYLSVTPWKATDEASLKSDVDASLSAYFQVHTIKVESSTFDPGQWSYRAIIDATVLSSYGSLKDVESIFRHSFYEATGYFPQVTITQTNGLPTSEPGQTSPDTSSGFPSIDWKNILQTGFTGVVILVAVIVGVFVFVNKEAP